jgi:hypothetical protein
MKQVEATQIFDVETAGEIVSQFDRCKLVKAKSCVLLSGESNNPESSSAESQSQGAGWESRSYRRPTGTEIWGAETARQISLFKRPNLDRDQIGELSSRKCQQKRPI